jgi:hypothetical protein
LVGIDKRFIAEHHYRQTSLQELVQYYHSIVHFIAISFQNIADLLANLIAISFQIIANICTKLFLKELPQTYCQNKHLFLLYLFQIIANIPTTLFIEGIKSN